VLSHGTDVAADCVELAQIMSAWSEELWAAGWMGQWQDECWRKSRVFRAAMKEIGFVPHYNQWEKHDGPEWLFMPYEAYVAKQETIDM
jgi:hypothetical protein